MKPLLQLFALCPLLSAPLAADTLSLGSTNAAAGSVLQLPFSFTNTHQIVGMQFDLKFPAGLVEAGSAVAASATTNHVAESREVAAGNRRIVLYSSSNQLLPSDLVLEVPLTLKTGSPQGGPTVNVSNILLTNAQGQTFTPSINRPQLDAWRLANFTEVERNEPTIIGDDRDLDGDGLSNLLEFLMGGNPKQKQASHELLTAQGIDPLDNKRYLTLLFRGGKNITAGTLGVEGSDDLATWNSTGIILTPTGTEDATSIEYEAAIEVDGLTKKFLRLVGARNVGQ
ncbi:MAG: hypothetical protein JNN17_02965 [Verrucomicrobiaceae bacterium]|nr:hypothetical protein [Verrucomicrobiaceae bacterium]